MRLTALAFVLFTLQPALAGAQVLPPMEGYTVEVAFSKGLDRRMDSINNLEQKFEERFRKNRHDEMGPRKAGTRRYAASRTAGTEWAGERLIGNVSDFTLGNIVKALVAYNVNRAAPDFRGRIEIDIETLKLSNPSVAFLDSFQSYATGRVRVTTVDGSTLFEDKVRVNLVVNSTVDRSYDGPALAFAETDPSRRVGPTLAYFVKRALEKAWPDRADDIAGPVIIRISEPNEKLIID